MIHQRLGRSGVPTKAIQSDCQTVSHVVRLSRPTLGNASVNQTNCACRTRPARTGRITCTAVNGHAGPDASATGILVGARSAGSGRTPRMSSQTSSLQLAWSRAQETQQAQAQPQESGTGETSQSSSALVLDPYAQGLLALDDESTYKCDPLTQLIHVLATRYIDDTLQAAMAATSVNTISQGDYRQVVLVGDGLDTRPFRLLWPEGTIIFLVAPRESHDAAIPLLKAAGAHVPRGCLLRRVPSDTATSDEGFLGPLLEKAGYQPNRLSVWVLQGLASQGMTKPAVEHLLMDVTTSAAFNSLVLGEFPAAMTRKQAENLLAEFGLLSTVLPFGHEAVSLGRWTAQHSEQMQGPQQRWLFTGQQMRLSLAQEGVYEEHVNAQVDEDFFGNVS